MDGHRDHRRAYGVLGLLLWTGAMDLAVAGRVVIAIRTGSANLEALVVQFNYLYEESLFVADLERLCQEADRRLIPETGRPLPAHVDAIRFENVSYTYPGTATEPALDAVNVTIPTGRIIALVGNNGSGKSTLAKLLCGLYPPDTGRILWDGIDSTELDRGEFFDRIAVVAQDFYRWPFTVMPSVKVSQTRMSHRSGSFRPRQASGDKAITAGDSQQLRDQLARFQHEKQELERILAEANDSLAAARASLRRMIRAENSR